MIQTSITSWCRPSQQPGSGDAGPTASSVPAPTTGASANARPARGLQSSATGRPPRTSSLVLAHWNAEGIRNKKAELQNFLTRNEVDIICIQETHLTDNHKFFIRGYSDFRQDRKNRHKGGIITLVRNTIAATKVSSSREQDELEFLTVKLLLPRGDMYVTNCYSPPNTTLQLHKIEIHTERHVVLGDFNSHSPSWGYNTLDARGEEVENWMLDNTLLLINNPADQPTYFSRAWKTQSTPDLAIATEDLERISNRIVYDQLGGSDHRPILLNLNTEYRNPTNMQPSWNLKRANWDLFSCEVDTLSANTITEEQHLNKNVKLLTENILKAAKKAIPRGKRNNYRPCWNEEVENLNTQLNSARKTMENSPTPDNRDKHNALLKQFNEAKNKELRSKWQEKTENLDMEKDTTKLWKLAKALNEDREPPRKATTLLHDGNHYSGKMAANILADYYQDIGKNNVPATRIKEVRTEIRRQKKTDSTD